MDQPPVNPKIEWCKIKGRKCLKFTFEGVLTGIEAEKAIVIWKEEFEKQKGGKVVIIWHCLKMKDYEPAARVIWQKTIKELKSQIDSIWLVTDSLIIKTGATIMSIFTSFDTRVVGSEDEILAKR